MTDALERLKKRNRPTVPNRDASLTPMSQPTTNLDIGTSRYLDLNDSKSLESQISQLSEPEPPLKTKQTTLRLEQEISARLQELCRQNGICREVLIEAMFEYSEANQDALRNILSEARDKNEQRQQIANLKRAQSMMKRFGQST
jgi:predicted DNA-binding protein